MNPPNPVQTVLQKASPSIVGGPALSAQLRLLAIFTLVLAVCFIKPLYEWARFALHSDLFSHVLLMPFVSFYLAWLQKDRLPQSVQPDRNIGLATMAAAAVLLLGYFASLHSALRLVSVDSLAWLTFCFYLFFLGACFFCLGRQVCRSLAFPLAFLVFIVPFPAAVTGWIESFLQHTSADAADAGFALIGMPFVRYGLFFHLPGIRIEIARECSGIHSTLVLFLTSLIAGQLFFRSPWSRIVLALIVIPLGILRNALRICTIGYLCVHVSPDMIDAPIHKRGGPLFFVVSLIPLFVLLYFLRKLESKAKAQGP